MYGPLYMFLKFVLNLLNDDNVAAFSGHIMSLELFSILISLYFACFQVVRMFIIVFSIFAFCWLPYHGYFIYAYHNNSITASNYVQHMYLAFYWLAMSNAMVNPLIYYWMNNR